ncbi:MAG: threonine synthase [Bacteroidia bacterium]
MQYYSLNKKSVLAGFKEAAIPGQAPDGGLYFPRYIPKLDHSLLGNLKSLSKEEIAFRIMKPYVGDALNDEELFSICRNAIDLDFPLVKVDDDISSLELFHGSTMAFKDVGAKFMSGCFSYFFRAQSWKVTVLVATSGDTGGAVANSFLNVPGVNVVILYPSGKVSSLQEKQLTTLGNNVTALEINGTFDDCQRMVKQAFSDEGLKNKLQLVSANSINIARWLPQQFYYFYALQQWNYHEPPVISVPCGNFGNICAGLLAKVGGLPVKHFIAACNENDTFTQYLHSGVYSPRKAVQTLSNAMDVGDPSNFLRILKLFDDCHLSVRENVSSFSVNDSVTLKTIGQVYREHNYLLDPHGAVAYYLLRKYTESHRGSKGIFLETAHPAKFDTVIRRATGKEVKVPERLNELMNRKGKSIKMEPDFGELKEFLFYTRELV